LCAEKPTPRKKPDLIDYVPNVEAVQSVDEAIVRLISLAVPPVLEAPARTFFSPGGVSAVLLGWGASTAGGGGFLVRGMARVGSLSFLHAVARRSPGGNEGRIHAAPGDSTLPHPWRDRRPLDRRGWHRLEEFL